MTSRSEARFVAYVEDLSTALGHADRTGPLRDYCLGLLMPVERKRVEPMAAVTAPARVAAQHQSLLHFVGQGGWSDDRVLAKVRDLVLPAMERNGAIEAWIIDDTGFRRRGSTRWASPANTAVNSANRTTARWLCLCRSPTTRPACRSPTSSTCRKTGQPIPFAGARLAFRMISCSAPSLRSRSTRSERPLRPASRAVSC